VRLAVFGIRKFWTRSATVVSLIIAVGLVVFEFVVVGITARSGSAGASGLDPVTVAWLLTFPNAFDAVLVLSFEFLAIVGLIYVATASGSEWTWGTLKVAVTRGHSRWHYTLSTFASLAMLILVGLLITYAAGLVAALAGASIAGLSPGNPADSAVLPGVLARFARCWIALVSLTSVAYVITMVAKSQMAGIGAVIGYSFVSMIAPALLPDFVKEIFKYLPFSISAEAIGITGPAVSGTASTSGIDPNVALLITIGWLLACLAVACLSVERAEVAG
jgi:ABC-type transport system involved in multi-copper enzyme maturation permease subunit